MSRVFLTMRPETRFRVDSIVNFRVRATGMVHVSDISYLRSLSEHKDGHQNIGQDLVKASNLRGYLTLLWYRNEDKILLFSCIIVLVAHNSEPRDIRSIWSFCFPCLERWTDDKTSISRTSPFVMRRLYQISPIAANRSTPSIATLSSLTEILTFETRIKNTRHSPRSHQFISRYAFHNNHGCSGHCNCSFTPANPIPLPAKEATP
jgi:hypothetical protein